MREGAAKGRGEIGRALQGLGRGLGVHPRPQEWQQLVYSEPEARPGPTGQPSAVFLQMALQPLQASSQAFQLCHTPAPLQGTEAADAAGGQRPASRSRSWVLETIL